MFSPTAIVNVLTSSQVYSSFSATVEVTCIDPACRDLAEEETSHLPQKNSKAFFVKFLIAVETIPWVRKH